MFVSPATLHPPIGTKLGEVMPPRILAGWPIVATGDGRSIISSPTGTSHRRDDESVSADLAWDAVEAFFVIQRAAVQS